MLPIQPPVGATTTVFESNPATWTPEPCEPPALHNPYKRVPNWTTIESIFVAAMVSKFLKTGVNTSFVFTPEPWSTLWISSSPKPTQGTLAYGGGVGFFPIPFGQPG